MCYHQTMTKRQYPWLAEVAADGGKARWKDVPKQKREEIARAAADARWKATPRGPSVSAAARRAVMARWAKYRARQQAATQPRRVGRQHPA